MEHRVRYILPLNAYFFTNPENLQNTFENEILRDAIQPEFEPFGW